MQQVTEPAADSSTYGIQITVANVGHTVESVLEIGLCRPPDPRTQRLMRWSSRHGDRLEAVSAMHFERGRTDALINALQRIEQSVANVGPSRGRMLAFRFGYAGLPRSPAWPLPPGGIAQIEQSLLVGEDDEGHPTERPDGETVSGPLIPYARLARGTIRFGRVIDVDGDLIDSIREAMLQ